jgi:hypothetical protein
MEAFQNKVRNYDCFLGSPFSSVIVVITSNLVFITYITKKVKRFIYISFRYNKYTFSSKSICMFDNHTGNMYIKISLTILGMILGIGTTGLLTALTTMTETAFAVGSGGGCG